MNIIRKAIQRYHVWRLACAVVTIYRHWRGAMRAMDRATRLDVAREMLGIIRNYGEK